MKNPVQLQAELNTKSQQDEARYVELREGIGKTLQRIHTIKYAIATFEMKLETAQAEFDQEIRTIEDNFK